MDINSLAQFIQENQQILSSSLSAVVGSILTTLFMRKNTSIAEFEKIKAGHFEKVIENLLSNGQMSYLEYYRTRNFLKIAKKADAIQNVVYNNNNYDANEKEFDFDWYIRFFNSASNISNEDMQYLWAAVLARKINNTGTFSLRTLETLYNMTKDEAELFSQISKIVLDDCTIFSSMDGIGEEINKSYGFDNDSLRLLEEIGLLNGLRMESVTELEPGECGGFENNGKILLYKSISNKKIELKYTSYRLTIVGMQLLGVVRDMSDDYNYLYDLGKEIQKIKPLLQVSLHPIESYDPEEDCVNYNPNIDLLN